MYSQIGDLDFDESDLEIISSKRQIISCGDLLLINDGKSNILELHTSDINSFYIAKAKKYVY